MKKVGQKIVVLSLRFMFAKISCHLFLIAALPFLVAAQSYQGQGRATPDDTSRQIKTNISELKNEVRNHEMEIRTFEEKLHNQETTLENIRQQLFNEMQQGKDYIRSTSSNLEGKIHPLDNSLKGVISDLKQLQNQANDSIGVLNQYKQKLSELEQIVTAQNEHMRHLEAALKSIMEVLQVKETASKEIASVKCDGASGTYKVQSGDSLEKIARIHKVSIKSLKEANNLSSDRINIGQTLKIPN
jgi:LysM repeat protein